MDMKFGYLDTPWNFIEKMADEETKKLFELDDILVTISVKIINYRSQNGLTQKQIAQKLGISQAMVSKLESGEYNPTVELLWKVSKKLNWRFQILLDEQIQPKQHWKSDINGLIIEGQNNMIDAEVKEEIA